METDKSNAEVHSATRIHELDAAALTRNGEIGVIVRTMWLLKSPVAVGQNRVDTASFRACETAATMSHLRAIVEELNQTVSQL